MREFAPDLVGGKSASPSSNAATQEQWRYNKANERTSWPFADLACPRSLAARARRRCSGTRLHARSRAHDEPRRDRHRALALEWARLCIRRKLPGSNDLLLGRRSLRARRAVRELADQAGADRKSTRLNSSH